MVSANGSSTAALTQGHISRYSDGTTFLSYVRKGLIYLEIEHFIKSLIRFQK